MGIGINLKFFNDSVYGNYQNLNDPRIPVIRKMILELASIPELKTPQDLRPIPLIALDITSSPDNQIIDLILVDSAEALEAWNIPDDALGCHVIEDWQSGCEFAERHKVVINMQMDTLTNILDSEPDSHFDSLIESWLMTITHEIAHCVEFIECSGGLTPHLLQVMLNEADSDLTIDNFSTGAGIRENAPCDSAEAIESMESRVEQKGFNWFYKILPALQAEITPMAVLLRLPIRNNNRAEWPITVRHDPFTHVGNLTNDAPPPRHSLEGSCVSVSDHPGDWKKIAKLSGVEWYIQKEAALILDVLVTKKSPELMDIIKQWGINTGLINLQQRYKSFMTDECGEESYIVCNSRQEAIDEAGSEDNSVEEFECPVGTSILREIHNFNSEVVSEIALDFCIMAYAENVLGVDGVWWEEKHDPWAYSAPRGGLFNPTSGEWEVTEKDTMKEISIKPNKRFQLSPITGGWVKVFPSKNSAYEPTPEP